MAFIARLSDTNHSLAVITSLSLELPDFNPTELFLSPYMLVSASSSCERDAAYRAYYIKAGKH